MTSPHELPIFITFSLLNEPPRSVVEALVAADTWRSLDTSEDGKVSHSEWLSAWVHSS